MKMSDLAQACYFRHPVAIVLQRTDYEQAQAAMAGVSSGGDWDKERMTYRGSPIVCGRFDRSYLIEDTPDGPLIHMIG